MNAEIHRPKVELFDVAGMTNTDPKGFVRAVDDYRLTDFGLYMARPVDGHPEISYFRSWLLPGPGLRVSRWGAHPGASFAHDYYIDIVDIEPGPVWRTLDLYLDILLSRGHGQQLLDVDEVLAATAAGLIDQAAAQRAIERAFVTADGIAAAGHDVDGWLTGQNIPVEWPEP